MTTMVLVSVFDSAVKAFNTPFCVRTAQEARRSFSDAVADPKMEFGKHAEDYSLYMLASFDASTGQFRLPAEPELLMRAQECFPVS